MIVGKSFCIFAVLSGEDDIRKKMVVLFNPTVYSQLLDFQLTNNRVTLHVMKMSTSCEDWRYVCAEVRGEKVNHVVKMTVPEYTKELFRQQ